MTFDSMIPKDLFQKVRRIQITTSRLVTDVFAGQYHSVFKGQGVEFDEVREYQPGDDIRTIDWNVTARTGRPHIKKYVEERELTVMILVDASRSARFGSVKQLKSRLAAEVAALLAFSAIRNNDKVGLIIFTDQIEKFIPPRKGQGHVLRVIREILYHEPRKTGTDLSLALEYLSRVLSRRAIAFVISDFYECAALPTAEPTFKKALTLANKRHDVVGVSLNDPRERELPDCGLVRLTDAETGRQDVIDTSDSRVRQDYARQALERTAQREKMFRSAGIDHIAVNTDVPYVEEMIKFFLARRKQRRRGAR